MLTGRSRATQPATISASLACLVAASSGDLRFQLRSGMMLSGGAAFGGHQVQQPVGVGLAVAGAVQPGWWGWRRTPSPKRVKSSASGKVVSSGWMCRCRRAWRARCGSDPRSRQCRFERGVIGLSQAHGRRPEGRARYGVGVRLLRLDTVGTHDVALGSDTFGAAARRA